MIKDFDAMEGVYLNLIIQQFKILKHSRGNCESLNVRGYLIVH